MGVVAAVLILVVEASGTPVRPAFLEALRLHLADESEVEAGPALQRATLAERVGEAAALAAERDALLAVWVEALPAGDGEVTFVLYGVGPRTSRALVEVGRVPATRGIDVDRALALKAGAFVDALLAARPRPGAEVDVTRSAARELPPPAPAPAPPAPAPPGLVFTVDLGAVVAEGAGQDRLQAGFAAAAGVAWRRPRRRLELVGVYRAVQDSEFGGANGERVVAAEVVAGLAARALVERGRLRFGLLLEADARLVDVEGRAPSGTSGTDRALVPVLDAGLEGRLALAAGVELRLAVAAEVALIRKEFTVAGVPVADLGRVRPVATLALVVSP